MTPATSALMSTLTLSVSTTAMTSSTSTAWPTVFVHCTTVPSLMLSPSVGILTSCAASRGTDPEMSRRRWPPSETRRPARAALVRNNMAACLPGCLPSPEPGRGGSPCEGSNRRCARALAGWLAGWIRSPLKMLARLRGGRRPAKAS
eukprot:CAMPEP_0118886386 /NCGR_PEP_ID=MMETSP1163-20130328/24492_1 /TAXON_ID=124430 /ORGANISM="Phaeomonas parva, Strain CCMP2877" /LENGTH=146 /DNA_ID=CAMNT_0006824589 /DNA_START=96 /DNA_END=539 /DNA_ORIENTATION=-